MTRFNKNDVQKIRTNYAENWKRKMLENAKKSVECLWKNFYKYVESSESEVSICIIDRDSVAIYPALGIPLEYIIFFSELKEQGFDPKLEITVKDYYGYKNRLNTYYIKINVKL